MPASPNVSAGAASCLQGWAPVAMEVAGGAPSRWLIPGPAPPRPPPPSLWQLLQQPGRQNHLVCDQRGRRQALPYLSQAWGTFQTQDSKSPVGQEGQAECMGKILPGSGGRDLKLGGNEA